MLSASLNKTPPSFLPSFVLSLSTVLIVAGPRGAVSGDPDAAAGEPHRRLGRGGRRIPQGVRLETDRGVAQGNQR